VRSYDWPLPVQSRAGSVSPQVESDRKQSKERAASVRSCS
jgi:hypothetical protein